MAQISLTLPDGAKREYAAGTTGLEVAADISKSLAKSAIACSVDGALSDLSRPLEADADFAIHTMKDEDEDPFTPEDLAVIEKKMREIINLRDEVRTEVWDRPRAIQHYTDNNEPFKVELIEAIPGDEPLRMYWHGHWQDLCRGPHLVHTGQVPADGFKLMSVAGAYWRGDSDNKMLQRIYGVGFKSRQDLQAHLTMLEEAAKRDHRKLGREMNLFHMHPPQATRWRLCRGEHTSSGQPQALGRFRPLGKVSGKYVHRRSGRGSRARKIRKRA